MFVPQFAKKGSYNDHLPPGGSWRYRPKQWDLTATMARSNVHNFHLCQDGILLLNDLFQHGHATVGHLVEVGQGSKESWELARQECKAYKRTIKSYPSKSLVLKAVSMLLKIGCNLFLVKSEHWSPMDFELVRKEPGKKTRKAKKMRKPNKHCLLAPPGVPIRAYWHPHLEVLVTDWLTYSLGQVL